MKTLVLLLAGPMQSWGERAKFTHRDTLTHPTRSGVVGMLACALGLPRGADLSWAQPLTVHVRVDRAGTVARDYHTVGGRPRPGSEMRTAGGGKRANAVLTYRHYLHDAAYLVTVTVPDDALADRLAVALRAPRWPLFLGRKSCPPAHPVLLGVTDADPLDVMREVPLYRPGRPGRAAVAATDWFDAATSDSGQTARVAATVYLDKVAPSQAYTVTNDDPVSFGTYTRAHTSRPVGVGEVHAPEVEAATPAAAGTYRQMRDAVHTLTRTEA